MATLISKCDGENVVLQVDFSENATIASQNETQSAHWCHGQTTLFTAYAWIKEDENESFVLVSDDLTHTSTVSISSWSISGSTLGRSFHRLEC